MNSKQIVSREAGLNDEESRRQSRARCVSEAFTRQELLGHKDVSTTMIYTHVLNKPGIGVKSPLD